MKIINKKVSELIPYENNPRINDEAVEYVKNSIKEFGFKVPIIIDKNNVIVAGHTRLKASKELEIKEVPCIVADDLTEEQIKAFRLADNKVAEKSMWDYSKLDEELDSILDIDMSLFDFEEFDDSYINDLMQNEFSNINGEKTLFSVTFTFDKEYEEKMQTYLKENGKENIVKLILEEIDNA